MNATSLIPVLDALTSGNVNLAANRLRALVPGAPLISPPEHVVRELERLDADVDAARSLVDEAVRRRSARLRTVLAIHGPGPYLVRGVPCAIVARGDTHFLRVLPRVPEL